jgi:hypothetical protein
VIPTDVFVLNWAGGAAVAVVLLLAVTAGRRARWGRPGVRWLLAACLAVFAVELVNLYEQPPWGSFLFIAALPFWIMAVVVEIRSWRRDSRGGPARHGGRRRPGDSPEAAWPPAPDEAWPPGPAPTWPYGPRETRPPGPGEARPPGPGGVPDWYR